MTSPPPSEKLSGSLAWKRKAEIRSVTPSLSKVVRPLSALLNGRPAIISSGGLQASAPASAVHRLLLRARAAAIECPPDVPMVLRVGVSTGRGAEDVLCRTGRAVAKCRPRSRMRCRSSPRALSLPPGLAATQQRDVRTQQGNQSPPIRIVFTSTVHI